MAQGDWAAYMAYWRFVNNPQVTTDDLIEGWSRQTATVVSGRHVLAIQDTSEIKFQGHRRGLGEVGKGNARGVLLHAMLAVDADKEHMLIPVPRVDVEFRVKEIDLRFEPGFGLFAPALARRDVFEFVGPSGTPTPG